jgi:hypothetical protein
MPYFQGALGPLQRSAHQEVREAARLVNVRPEAAAVGAYMGAYMPYPTLPYPISSQRTRKSVRSRDWWPCGRKLPR